MVESVLCGVALYGKRIKFYEIEIEIWNFMTELGKTNLQKSKT